MNKKLVNEKHISAFIMLCSLLYAASYVTRINFAAIISEIIKVEGITKSEASLVTTALFVAYGAGQLIFGIIGDRVNSAGLIGFGMAISSLLNFLMAVFCGNIYAMCTIWFLNGLAQAIMWPSLAKITSDYLSVEGYKRSCISIAIGGNGATVGMYILAPLLLSFIHYKVLFLICGAVGVLMTFYWGIKIGTFEGKREEAEIAASEKRGAFTSNGIGGATILVLCVIGIAVFIQGVLKDGITTWTPSFIQEVYSLPASLSILITVVLPVFSIISHKFGGYVHGRFIKNEVLCGGAFFAVAVVASVILAAVYNGNPIICVLLAAIITGSMHGINLMLLCMIPGRFEKQGKVATMSGILNFVSYAGSSVSTYFIASFAEKYNWRATVLLWAGLAAAGLIICLLVSNFFKNKKDA